MVWFVYIVIILYGLLTMIATVSQIIAKTFHVNHFMFIFLQY
ncbi:hypothetical protein [Oceanobacillus chungangensis]|nr:hypothetical protein [Oceanobacillus chungangensis]